MEPCPYCGTNLVSYDRTADIQDNSVTIENFFYCAICDKHFTHTHVGNIPEWDDQGWFEIQFTDEEE